MADSVTVRVPLTIKRHGRPKVVVSADDAVLPATTLHLGSTRLSAPHARPSHGSPGSGSKLVRGECFSAEGHAGRQGMDSCRVDELDADLYIRRCQRGTVCLRSSRCGPPTTTSMRWNGSPGG
jgi:hypothetical protein